MFRNISSLFVKKWSKTEKELPEYFENERLKTLDSWYERYSTYTRSTNNPLEATKRVIEDEHIFSKRHINRTKISYNYK